MSLTAPDVLLDDADVPALRAIRTSGLAAVVARAGLPAAGAHFEVYGYHPGRRCVVRFRAGDAAYVLTAYSMPVDGVLTFAQYAEAAGLTSGRGVCVPKVVTADEALRFVVTEALAGIDGSTLLKTKQGERAGTLATRWLLAASELLEPPAPTHAATEVLADAPFWVRDLNDFGRDFGLFAVDVFDALAQSPPDSRPATMINGAFSPRHVIDLDDRVGIVDWDRVRRGPIAFDAAHFIARVRRIGFLHRKRADATVDAERAMRRRLGDAIDPRELNWYLGAMLLQQAAAVAGKGIDQGADAVVAMLECAARVASV